MHVLVEECNPFADENVIDSALRLCKNGQVPITLPVTLSESVRMDEKKRSATIFDVADAAGVSVSTVSRVLNKKEDVSEATYERVRQVIDELGYSSSLAARSMRSRKTNVIGMILPDVGDPFSVEIMRGVNRGIVECGYDLLIYTDGLVGQYLSGTRQQQYVALLNSSVTDGVVIVTPSSGSFVSDSPVVAVDPNIDNPSAPSVVSTNFRGALDATNHLIELGHRRIGYIGGRMDLQCSHHRLEGYQCAFAEAGIPIDPQLIVPGDFTSKTAVKRAYELLSLDNPPTSIFAANDQSAFGVLIAAEEMNIRVPQDLSVIGYDNIPEALVFDLSTVDQFMAEMGYLATKMLIGLIQDRSTGGQMEVVDTELIVRGSTAPRQHS